MFLVEGFFLGSDFLEYVWLIDVQVGSFIVKVIVLQLVCFLEWGQIFVFYVVCWEYELERLKLVIICQYGIDCWFCEFKLSCIFGFCLILDDLKYIMICLVVDGVDIYIVEYGCVINIKMGVI